jgi:hypothetical protein
MALGLLLLGFPGIGRADGPYPGVRIEAQLKGEIFSHVSRPALAELVSGLEKRVKDAAKSRFECMEWVVEGEASKADIRARLFIVLTQRPYQDISWIDLSLLGAVGDSKTVPLWTAYAVASSLDWSPRDLPGLTGKVDRAIDGEFGKQGLRMKLDSEFIANIPIAERIEPQNRKVVVYVDAQRLNLEPGTLLKTTLLASLCSLESVKCSKMALMSEGPGDGGLSSLLRCRIDSLDCCPVPDWSSRFADRLKQAKDVKVYLSGDHRHCQFGPDHCPGPDGIYRNPSF